MGKHNTCKRGPSKIEIRMADRQAEGWTFHKHYKKRNGVKLLIGIKAEKDPFVVTGNTLEQVLNEIDTTDFDKLLDKHGLKRIPVTEATSVIVDENGIPQA